MNIITKKDFLRYYKVQMGGRYNMIMEAGKAMKAARLTKEQYFDIIKNYRTYYKEFIG